MEDYVAIMSYSARPHGGYVDANFGIIDESSGLLYHGSPAGEVTTEVMARMERRIADKVGVRTDDVFVVSFTILPAIVGGGNAEVEC